MNDLYIFKSSTKSLHQHWVLLVTAEDYPGVLKRVEERVRKIKKSGRKHFDLKDMKLYLREQDAPVTNVPYHNCLFLWKVFETTGDDLDLTGMEK